MHPSDYRREYRVSVYAGFGLSVLGWLLLVAGLLLFLLSGNLPRALLLFLAAGGVFLFAKLSLDKARVLRRQFRIRR